jgi:tRNA uridine 5-carboxymethylaminomethyl modification enzyme
MRRVLENQEHLTIRQQEVAGILTDKEEAEREGRKAKITGVTTVSGATYHARAVILCTGVYLAARCIFGDVSQYTGPNGLMAANHLSDSLRANGIELRRFKTGTPARIDKRSIDFSKMEEQKGDDRVVPFSFSTDPETVQIEQVSCWLTYTNENTHKVIRDNIDRSPLYGGVIKSTGPRYCPSIEDKVMKFAEKNRHQVFIEPEGKYTNEMYIDGMSSSMPEDVQFAMYRSVPGLENAKIVRNAYAIEYDCLAPKQLKSSLEFKAIDGLFSGGQFNGSSGYEEAAAQGLLAGINAAQYLRAAEPIVLLRSESYIGVLIDDLVTKDNFEPYRMMTSRAEYRLLLRQDNADIRLRKYGHDVGLISDEQMQELYDMEKAIENEISRVKKTSLPPSEEVNAFLASKNSTQISTGINLAELVRRPELSYQELAVLDREREPLSDRIAEQVNIEIKYEGYISRQMRQVEQFKKTEEKKIPADIDYDDVKSLRLEARQKLKAFRPESIGQASRIAGVTPADANVLLVYLKQNHM